MLQPQIVSFLSSEFESPCSGSDKNRFFTFKKWKVYERSVTSEQLRWYHCRISTEVNHNQSDCQFYVQTIFIPMPLFNKEGWEFYLFPLFVLSETFPRFPNILIKWTFLCGFYPTLKLPTKGIKVGWHSVHSLSTIRHISLYSGSSLRTTWVLNFFVFLS